MSRVKITSAIIGYPNGRYQEVPPKKPPNQKMLLSSFTQGVLRVPDLYKKNRNSKIFIFCLFLLPTKELEKFQSLDRRLTWLRPWP